MKLLSKERIGRWIEQGWGDLRHAVRSLARSPGFVAVAVLSFALGIGTNTAIFSLIDGVLLKPLPYAESERLVEVGERSLKEGWSYRASTLNAMDWISQNSVFEQLAAYTINSVALGTGEGAQPVRGAQASAGIFEILGARLEMGRAFLPGEYEPGNDRVVVLSHSLWLAQFGGDREILGRVISLDGVAHTVIGVLKPADALDRRYAQLWRTLAIAPEKRSRNYHWLQVLGRLKTGVSLARAQTQMDVIGARLARDFPESNRGAGVSVEGFDAAGGPLRQSLYLLLGATGLILLIACANLANLTLTRGLARAREVAIKTSLGAGRGRLVRQFLVESLLLATVGGALGVALGYAVMAGLKVSVLPQFLPPEAAVAMDGRGLTFALALTLSAGVVAGLVPAWRCSQVDPTAAMKEGAGSGRFRHRLGNALVVAQVALAFVLLSSAGLLLRSFARLQEIKVGDDPARIITVPLPIAGKWADDPVKFNAYLRQITEEAGALPGVQAAALASSGPLSGTYGMPFQVAGHETADPSARPNCFLKTATPDYFQVIGLQLRAGRALTARDARGAHPVAVINEAMARAYFPKEDPIGKHLLVEEIALGKPGLGREIAWEVVGVVENERVGALRWDYYPGIYVPSEQSPQVHQTLVLRTALNPALLQPALRKAIQRLNPDQLLGEVKTLEVIKDEAMGSDRLLSILLGLFAGLALSLGAIGIYGVLAYAVGRRTREMGIRAALGATPASILRLVLGDGLRLIGLGLVLGCAVSLALAQLLAAWLFGVGERDPFTLTAVAGLITGVALLACLIPARRAAKIDPMVALRYE